MSTVDLILRIISTLATLTIGVAASFLAYRQYKISHAKLKFDLYEKRLALFNMLIRFTVELANAHADGLDKTSLRIAQFYNRFVEHRFLFDDPGVATYFDTVYQKAKELEGLVMMVEEGREDGRPADRQKMFEDELSSLEWWFYSQHREMVQVFEKDLSIKTLK